ncbi:MAG: FGGY-family carbohydrate kinase [Gammaproteobacteria bacterium]|nr:FGGY-family carbohydrate kinase [Gammaproteobacteria bacterium]
MDTPRPAARVPPWFLGIDLGTSGIRASVIDAQRQQIAQAHVDLPPPRTVGQQSEQDPGLWWQGLVTLLGKLSGTVDLSAVAALAIDGTSGTVLLTDAHNTPLTPALMYNDARAQRQVQHLNTLAPHDSPVQTVSAGLPKILWLYQSLPTPATVKHICHQADWIVAQLTRCPGHSDSHNCLKTGYDPVARRWPDWLRQLEIDTQGLPQVHPPGEFIAPIETALAKRFGFAPHTAVIAGSTDSHAAVLATGIQQPGDAVTSLGSTLVVKIISRAAVFNAAYGVYSQPFGEYWLVGGASNSGGAVLRQFFTDPQLHQMTPQINPGHPTHTDYYPLCRPGERFPIADPTLVPRLTPRPSDDVVFFQGLLEGMARIEYQGYQRLHQLGTPRPGRIATVGGGAANQPWKQLRQRLLQVPIYDPPHTAAAYGAALLARQGYQSSLRC